MVDNESLTRESRRNVKFYDESGRARSFSDSNDASIIQRVSFTLARIDEYVCVFVTRVFCMTGRSEGRTIDRKYKSFVLPPFLTDMNTRHYDAR